MSIRGPESCPCCGKEERTSGCVRGPVCGCAYYDFSLSYDQAMCARCEKCKKHCQCKDGLLTREESVKRKLEDAGVVEYICAVCGELHIDPDKQSRCLEAPTLPGMENFKPNDYRAAVVSLAKKRAENARKNQL